MKRIARLLAVSLVLLGVMLISLPARALAANPYPSPSEVYVAGQPVSDYTGSKYSYDPLTGTLTLNGYSGYGPIEVRASGARDFTVRAEGYCSVYTYSKTPGVTTDVYAIANETGGLLTLQSTGGKRFTITAKMTEQNSSIQNIAAIRCTGSVYLQCIDNSSFYIEAINNDVVDGHAVAATHAPAYGIWANGLVCIDGNNTTSDRSTIRVRNADTTLTAANPSAAIRVGNLQSVQIVATGKWSLDTRYCDGVSATILGGGTARPSFSIQNATEVCASYGVDEKPDTDFFVMNSNGASWSPAQIDVAENMGYAADKFWNGVYFRPDTRVLIPSTSIILNEVPPIGAGAQIVDNCTVDASVSTPRYTLLSSTGFRYKVGEDDVWHSISGGSIPENATQVSAYFRLQANDGYRLSNATSIGVKLPNGNIRTVTAVDTNSSANNPTGTPSTCAYYVELNVANDLPDAYPIDSVQITNVKAPQDGETALVSTGSSTPYPGSLPTPSADCHYTWAFTGAPGYSSLVVNPALTPGYAYWMDRGTSGTDTPTIVPANSTFQKGHYYTLVVFLYAKPGYKFPSDRSDCSTYVNGKPAVLTTNVNGNKRLAKVESTFQCPAEAISEVSIIGVTEPVAGATAVADGTVPDGAPYRIATSSVDDGRSPQYWYEGDTNISYYNLPEEFTGTFEENTWYTYVVYLEPDTAHGYRFNTGSGTGVFQSQVAGTINGEAYAEPCKKVGDASNGPIMIRRAFFVAASSAVSRVDIAQTMPVAGVQSVGDAASQTAGVTMQVFGEGSAAAGATSMWVDLSASSYDEMFMPVFQTGKTYTLMATAEATDGAFDVGSAGLTTNPAVKVFVEGIPAGVLLFADDGYTTAEITLSYTIPASSDGVPLHCLYVPTGMGLSVDNGEGFHIAPPLADYVNIDGSGYDLHFIREGANVEVGIWWYGSTWTAPEGEEFYKWEVIKGDIAFNQNIVNDWNGFTMPAGDVVIDALTAPSGTVPESLSWSYFDHRECTWDDADNQYPVYNGTMQRNWYVLIDGKNSTDPNDDYTLQPGTDYSITYADEAGNVLAYTDDDGNIVLNGDGPVNAGQVTVTYTGIPHPGTDHPGYEGTKTDWYVIMPADINVCDVAVNATFTDDSVTPEMPYEYFTNAAHEPPVTVTTPWGDELVAGEDYSVYYEDNVNVSNEVNKARAVVSGAGGNWASYNSTDAVFEIRPRDINDEDIVWTASTQTYTGNAIEPWSMYEVSGTYNGYGLYPDSGFTIDSYSNNVFPGQASINVTGQESYNFTGTTTLHFDIQADLDAGYMDYSGTEGPYTWPDVEPKPTVTILSDTYGNHELVEGVDYMLEYEDNTSAGTARVVVKPADTVHFTGERAIEYQISALDIKGAEIAPIPNQSYTGSAVKPKPTVTYGGTTLKQGTDYDYTVSYENNVEVGTATVTITGKGYFTGTKSAEFQIVQSLSDASVTVSAQTYTGSALKPAPTVKLGGKTLKAGTDYEVTGYSNNTNVGTATITVTGKGNYTGTATGSFKVKAASISSATVTADAQSYTGSAIKPAPTVKLGSRTLKSGTDYTVSYKSNTAVGTATITVTGKGNYTGTASGTFTITAADLSGAKVTVSGGTYTGSALEPAPTVKLGSKTLKAGTDYTVSYSDNVEVGTATVTVTGKGNYTGTATGTFKITAPEDPGFESPFIDVYEDTYHSDDILWMYYQGISKGWDTPAGLEYRPMESVARCDMAAFLYRLAGSPSFTPSAADKAYFSDVDDETPHCNEVWWLAHEGISKGWTEEDGTHTFRPYDSIARCDMAAFLMRLALGGDAEETYTPSAADLSAFSDIDADSPHANAVWWLANTGVSKGFEDGTFRPYDDIKRCDMAAFLHRMKEYGLI